MRYRRESATLTIDPNEHGDTILLTVTQAILLADTQVKKMLSPKKPLKLTLSSAQLKSDEKRRSSLLAPIIMAAVGGLAAHRGKRLVFRKELVRPGNIEIT